MRDFPIPLNRAKARQPGTLYLNLWLFKNMQALLPPARFREWCRLMASLGL